MGQQNFFQLLKYQFHGDADSHQFWGHQPRFEKRWLSQAYFWFWTQNKAASFPLKGGLFSGWAPPHISDKI